MARSKLFLFSLLLLVLSFIAAHGAGDPPKAAMKTGPRLLFPYLYKSLRLEQPAPPSFDGGDLPGGESKPPSVLSLSPIRCLPPEPLYGPRIYRLSRFESSLKGAGAGARLGLFLGAIANSVGGRNDPMTFYMMGAGAAAGALFGGTLGAEHSRWSVGVDWGRENARQPGEYDTN